MIPRDILLGLLAHFDRDAAKSLIEDGFQSR